MGANNAGQTILGQVGVSDADMNIPEAWPQSTGSSVTVAVADSGVQFGHPDLASGSPATRATAMRTGSTTTATASSTTGRAGTS